MPEAVAEKFQKIKRNPRRPYTPYGAARILWGCRDEEVLIEGPAGTGKTRAVLEKIFFMAMKYPGLRALLVRKTRESMTQSVLQILEEWVIPTGSPLLDGPQRGMRQTYKLTNGSEIAVGGLDKPEKIMSTEYDVVGIFEATETTEKDYELITTRMGRRAGVIPYNQVIADCNPDAPGHYLNKRANREYMTRLKSRLKDNPVMYDQEKKDWTDTGKKYLKKLDRLTGVRRDRLLDGRWAASEGAVYPEWNTAEHIITEMPAGWEKWRKVRGIDFGFNNPFVCLWAAVDPDGDIYIYREMYHSHRIVRQHASGVWDMEADEGPKLLSPGIKQLSVFDGSVEVTVADHDREDRATLESEGIDTVPAYKEIDTGIEAVKLRLRPQLHGNGEIKPRLYFLADALVERDADLIEENLPTCTAQEFEGYIYGKVKEGKSATELPVDKDNHGLDTIRYIVAYVDDIGGTQIEISAEMPTIVEGNQW